MAKAKYTAIGGQALIEGILMKSPEKTAMAVRKKDGEIDISYPVGKSIREKYKILRIPIIRGIVGFVESMVQGYKAMMLSADISGFTDLEDEDDKKKKDKKENITEETAEEGCDETEISKTEAETDKKAEKKDNGVLMGVIMVIASVLGVGMAIGLFMFVPRIIVGFLQDTVFRTEFSPVVRSLIIQSIKLCVFVLYIWLVAFMKDIRRVFMYHGAEHKTIFCYEKGLELNVENVRKQKRFHPRCGTSFMILMILINIFFSTVVQIIFNDVFDNPFLWTLVMLLMLPIICGVGFEVLRACGKYDNIFTRIISAPGMWLQHITTKEPDDGMIEIAIAAIRACEPENPDVDRSIDNEITDTTETEE